MNVRPIKFDRPLLVCAVALAVASVALLFVATKPLREKITVENDEIQKFYAKTENDQRKISRLLEFRDQSVMIANDEAKLKLLLPENRIVDFIRNVEEIAKSTGGTVTIAKGSDLVEARKVIVVSSAQSGGTDDEGKVKKTEKGKKVDGLLNKLPDGKTIGLTLTFTGRYADSVNFLHKVDSSPYFLDVFSMKIRPIGSDGGSGSVRSDMFAVPESGSTPASAESVESDPKVEAECSIVVYLE